MSRAQRPARAPPSAERWHCAGTATDGAANGRRDLARPRWLSSCSTPCPALPCVGASPSVPTGASHWSSAGTDRGGRSCLRPTTAIARSVGPGPRRWPACLARRRACASPSARFTLSTRARSTDRSLSGGTGRDGRRSGRARQRAPSRAPRRTRARPSAFSPRSSTPSVGTGVSGHHRCCPSRGRGRSVGASTRCRAPRLRSASRSADSLTTRRRSDRLVAEYEGAVR